MGRRTKRTPQVEQTILDALRDGCTRTAASEAAGVHRAQFYTWLQTCPAFRDAVTRAEAEVEVFYTGTLRKAAEEDWRAAFSWLERRRPNDWSRVDRVEITLRQEAQRLAGQLGLDPAELVAEAERIVAEAM